jgi:hypothetical protein
MHCVCRSLPNMAAAAAGIWLLAPVAAVFGQDDKPQPPPGATVPSATSEATAPVPGEAPVEYTLRVGGVHGFKTDLSDTPGRVSVSRAGAGLDVVVPVLKRGQVRLGAETEWSHYSFDGATGLIPGTADPFSNVLSDTLSVAFVYQQTQHWGWLVGGSVSAGGEEHAKFGDSISGGGSAGARYVFSDRLSLTAGATVQTRLEEHTRLLPLVLVDWKATDKLRIAGQVGTGLGSSLTIAYTPRPALTLTADAGYEFRQFRLDRNGPLPDGVVRDERIAIGIGAIVRFSAHVSLRAQGGAYVSQTFKTRDSAGNEISNEHSQPAPFAGLQLTVSF